MDSLIHQREFPCVPLMFRITAVVFVASMAPISVQADEPKEPIVILESRGYLVPASQITVSPKVAGHVVELLIEEGQQVKAGEVLARLDSQECQVVLKVVHARLKLAEAEWMKAKEGAAGKADLAIAEAKVEVARAEMDQAQYKLDCTVVRAPINGVILARRAGVGSRIDPNAAQGPASLCDMADLQTLEVEVSIPEREIGKVTKGQTCAIQVDAFPLASYRGSVVRVQPVADRARAAVTVHVRVEGVPAAIAQLRPELTAFVQFMAKDEAAKP